MLAGALITASEYVQAQRLRTQLRADMNAVLRRVDVLATPTSPNVSFRDIVCSEGRFK